MPGRLTVGHKTLNLGIGVRIPARQHFDSLRSLSASPSVLSEAKCPEPRRRTSRYMYYVYLIQCEDGSIYTGITNNLERRFKEHKSKIGGHYTASHKVKEMVYTEEFKTKSEALKREAQKLEPRSFFQVLTKM